MADVPEFSKDSIPNANAGVWYRSTELVHAHGPFNESKVGGKKHSEPGYVIIHDANTNASSKVEWVEASEFDARFRPISEADRPYNPGPHFDAHEASEEQAEGYQMDAKVEGDREAAQVLQDPHRP